MFHDLSLKCLLKICVVVEKLTCVKTMSFYIIRAYTWLGEMSTQKPEDLLSVVISTELPPSPNSRQLFISQDQQVCLLLTITNCYSDKIQIVNIYIYIFLCFLNYRNFSVGCAFINFTFGQFCRDVEKQLYQKTNKRHFSNPF